MIFKLLFIVCGRWGGVWAKDAEVCATIHPDSVPADGVYLDCADLTYGCEAGSEMPYCSRAGCELSGCSGDVACMITRLPDGTVCPWTCKIREGVYVNCLTGVPEVVSTTSTSTRPSTQSSTQPPFSSSSSMTFQPVTTSTSTSANDDENETVTEEFLTSEADTEGVADTEETTATEEALEDEEPHINIRALPAAVACASVAGSVVGGVLFFAQGPPTPPPPEMISVEVPNNQPNSGTQQTVTAGAAGDHGVLQNRVENLVETVHGASSEQAPDVEEKLLQLSQGTTTSQGGATGGITSEVASKFLEDMISPFYK